MNPVELTKEITEAVMTTTHPESLVPVDQVGSVFDGLANYASTLTVSDGTTVALLVACLLLARQAWKKYKSDK